MTIQLSRRGFVASGCAFAAAYPSSSKASDMKTAIIVLASLRFRKNISDDLIAASLQMGRKTREEPGCLSYVVSLDVEDRRVLHFAETWRSLDDLAAHFRTAHMKAYRAALRAEGDMEPSMTVFRGEETRFSPGAR